MPKNFDPPVVADDGSVSGCAVWFMPGSAMVHEVRNCLLRPFQGVLPDGKRGGVWRMGAFAPEELDAVRAAEYYAGLPSAGWLRLKKTFDGIMVKGFLRPETWGEFTSVDEESGVRHVWPSFDLRRVPRGRLMQVVGVTVLPCQVEGFPIPR